MKIKLIAAVILVLFTGLGVAHFRQISARSAPDQTTEDSLFTSLKAVLIVGPQEDGTTAAMESMDKIAEIFRSKGVEVKCFYDTNAIWAEIKKESVDANFFVYSGHGSTMGEGGRAGGLMLDTLISSKRIINELKLPKGAMVFFKSVCRGAGTSAGDDGDIGIKEAENRVSDYSQPFFKIGASCYYANNMESSPHTFLKAFFSGKAIKACFEESAKVWAKIEMIKTYRYDNTKQIGIASIDWGGTTRRITYSGGVRTEEEIPASKNYDIAFVAKPDYTIAEMMK